MDLHHPNSLRWFDRGLSSRRAVPVIQGARSRRRGRGITLTIKATIWLALMAGSVVLGAGLAGGIYGRPWLDVILELIGE